MDNPTPAAEKRSRPGPPPIRQLPIPVIVAGGILLFLAAAILIYLGQRGAGGPAAETPSPTRAIVATPTMPDSPVPTPNCETIVSSDDVEVSLALPVTVTIGGGRYPVEPFAPQEDAWTYPAGRSDSAAWVCGTVVNYVLGLEPTEANEALVRDLAPGDEIQLHLTSGTVLRFRFSERREATPGAEDALSQQQPKLTLVLPGGESWLIAAADYAAEDESVGSPPAGVSAEPGQSVQVDGAQVTLVRGYVERSDELPAGTAYYLTEYSVENLGDVPLPTSAFATRLRDSVGNTYLVSPRGSRAGEPGPLSGDIEPGASAEGSAGYLVPDPLPGGELTWMFSLRPGAKELRVSIPYDGGTPEGGEASRSDVTITDAFLSDDGATLIIEGEVQNRGTQPLVVEASDVSLSSTAGAGQLVTAAPELPWTIEAGRARVIELQYERPDAQTAVLELLGYAFEIGGLR